MKTVFILRGIPGNGKSKLADTLCENYKSSVICCADDYFTNFETGDYNWDAEKIGSAHLWCKNLFKENLEDQTDIIVVANTNIRQRDVKIYRNLALEYNYLVFVLTVENWHDGQDSHNVPIEVKEKMKETLIKTIKL